MLIFVIFLKCFTTIFFLHQSSRIPEMYIVFTYLRIFLYLRIYEDLGPGLPSKVHHMILFTQMSSTSLRSHSYPMNISICAIKDNIQCSELLEAQELGSPELINPGLIYINSPNLFSINP